MAEQLEIAEAVEAVAREIYVLGVTAYDGTNREEAERRWDSGEVPRRNKFFYREQGLKLVTPALEPIARQVWEKAGEAALENEGVWTIGEYPGFEVTRG